MAPLTGDTLRAGLDAFNTGFNIGLIAGLLLAVILRAAWVLWQERGQ